jgi:type IV secretory pathway TraG/TraD family ATPase VirD4
MLGAETSSLIGSLVMASVWQSALERVNLPKELRRPVWLVADEFQDVVKLPLDLADMAAQARSLGLGLVLAHRYLAQLPAAVKTAVLGTVRSQIVFQLGRDDAGELAPAFAPLTAPTYIPSQHSR